MAQLPLAQPGERLTPSQSLRREIGFPNTARVEIRLVEEEGDDRLWLRRNVPVAREGAGRLVTKCLPHSSSRGDGCKEGSSQLLAEGAA